VKALVALMATFAAVYVVPAYLLGGIPRAWNIDPWLAAIVLWAASAAVHIALRRRFGRRLPRV
jgi:hypothetical protein